MKGWAVAAILAVLLVGQWWRGEQKDTEGARSLRAAQHTRDSVLARGAEKEIAWERDNRSLKATIAAYKQRPAVVVRHDTALVPIQEFIYVRDTLIPKCEQCAARQDSMRSQHADERRAANALIDLYQRRTKELERKIELGPRFESGIGVDRSLVVGDIRVSARGDVRLLGRIHGYVRAEHTFGYPPRSDIRVGIEARP